MMMFDMNVTESDNVTVDTLTEIVTKKKTERTESGYTDEQFLTSTLKALDPNETGFIDMDELRTALMCSGEKVPEADVCLYFLIILFKCFIYFILLRLQRFLSLVIQRLWVNLTLKPY